MSVHALESGLRTAGGIAALLMLAVALWRAWTMRNRAEGRAEGKAAGLLRVPVLLVATLAFMGAGWLLWRPIPLDLSPCARLTLDLMGTGLYFPSLLLYLWGLRTLGSMFWMSSGFGVRLFAGHRLIMEGPFAYVRHPMYLGVIVAGFGGLMLYRTWAMALFAVMMLGLGVRARREEQVLAAEFGDAWSDYARRVPAWLPRLRLHRRRSG